MSLARQLTVVLSGMFLLVFGGTIALSVENTRRYLGEQLESHAQDAASSLGLSLSPYMAANDLPVMEIMVDAMFDGGYYREIVVRSTAGEPLVSRVLSLRAEGVPTWFVRRLPLATPEGRADVMAGWIRGGTVSVRSHPGYAYRQLWSSTVETFWWSVGTLVVALTLGLLALRMSLRPLADVERQALAIADREFPQLTRLPWTRELRRVVVATNRMCAKVQSMLAEQTDLAERLREEAYVDPVTGVGNRRRFEGLLEQLAGDEDGFRFGALFLVRFGGLDEVNRARGYAAGDARLREAADTLRAVAGSLAGSVSRVGGAEFGLLLPGLSRAGIGDVAAELVDSLAAAREPGIEATRVNVGVAYFAGTETASELLAAADMALRHAEETGPDRWHLLGGEAADGDVEVHGKEAWREILETALAERAVVLLAQPVRSRLGDRLLHREVLVRLAGSDGGLVAAGVFLPVAIRLGLATRVDRLVVEETLARLVATPEPERVVHAINLCRESIDDPTFRAWLLAALAGAPGLGTWLRFEISEHHAVGALDAVRGLAADLRRAGSGLAVDHFGAAARSFGYLHDLKLAYIKVDGSYVSGIPGRGGDRFFIHALTDIAHGLDVEVVAEFVENERIWEVLRDTNVDGVQGFHVGRPDRL